MNKMVVQSSVLAAAIASVLVATAYASEPETVVSPKEPLGTYTEVKPDPNRAMKDWVNAPLTSVVVTQCNQIVAVYITLQDGKFYRFDSNSKIPSDQLLEMAYTAKRSERVEVSCNDNTGIVGYEKHDPV